MTTPVVDADLGALEERVFREASDEFWRYVAASARIGHGTTIANASRISGLSTKALHRLATVHWLLSEELGRFLDAVPATLARLSRTTSAAMGLGPEVRGSIDWSTTVALRAGSGWRVPTYAYVEAQAENDTPANRVFKTSLQWVSSAAGHMAAQPDTLLDDVSESEHWIREVSRRAGIAARALQHKALSLVRAPQRLSEHDLRVCVSQPLRGYRLAVAAVRLRAALVERGQQERIREMLQRRVLIPAQRFRLFEIWILARVARFFREAGWRETVVPLLSENRSTPVYRFSSEGRADVEVFFQATPVAMRRVSAYREIFEAYDVDVAARTPDIVIQQGPRPESLRVMIEAKASDNQDYIADGAYKLLGYAADFAAALTGRGGPIGLLVTKSRPELKAGAIRRTHRVWISNAAALDVTLANFLAPFTQP
jgi:hypothetical protein